MLLWGTKYERCVCWRGKACKRQKNITLKREACLQIDFPRSLSLTVFEATLLWLSLSLVRRWCYENMPLGLDKQWFEDMTELLHTLTHTSCGSHGTPAQNQDSNSFSMDEAGTHEVWPLAKDLFAIDGY